MAEETMKKTGATPLVPVESLGGGKVQGVVAVTTVLVMYTDGHGKKEVRLAAVIPGGEVYFFTNNAIDNRPAQQWLKAAVLDKLGSKVVSRQDASSMIDITEDNTTQV